MYTLYDYKKEISALIYKDSYDPARVAKKTYSIFMNHQRDIDKKLYDILLDVANMEMGPEFELTEKEFKKFLDKSL